MNDTERESILFTRLNDWKDWLRSKRATPVLIVGLTDGPQPDLVVTTCEHVSITQVRAMLMNALLSLQDDGGAAPFPNLLDPTVQLQDRLADLGHIATLAQIRSWTDDERTDVEQWARRRKNRHIPPENVPAMPDVLREAIT